MLNIKTKYLLIAAALLLSICLGFAAVKTCAREESIVNEEIPQLISLNDSLTNPVSDLAGFEKFDKAVEDYLAFWEIQGASLSVMKNDSLVYAKGYGKSDIGVPMEANCLLRMASVSKLITAAGIMVLQERDSLSIRDTVFGPSGILNDSIYTAAIKDKLHYKITVEDLLRHKGGFSRSGGDPMFATRTIMSGYSMTEVPTQEELTVIQLKRRLKFEPGTWQEYSNFGYLLLSMIIEKVSGQSYEDFIQENVLQPAGCRGFHIAGNYYEDRFPGETRYFVQDDDFQVEEFNNSGRMVDKCYGGNNVTGLSGAGAWISSTPELALFVASIDGRPEVPDILSEESVRQMTEYFDKDTYSLGWNDTKPTGEWTRTGTFSGTSALVKYFPDGECWVFIANTSTYKGTRLAHYSTELFEKLRGEFSAEFPKRNLFYGTSY